jgi:hypothetical protein
MILILTTLIIAIVFLSVSYTYIDDKMYQEHPILFFLLNSSAAMIILIIGSYLFIMFMLMGELYV